MIIETQYEEDECQEPAPKTISFYNARFTGGAVAQCSNCRFTSVFWECNCELEHDCDEYKGEK